MEKITDNSYGAFAVMYSWATQYKSLCLSTKRLAFSLCGLGFGVVGEEPCSLMHMQLSAFASKACGVAMQQGGVVYGDDLAVISPVLTNASAVKTFAPEEDLSCQSVQHLENSVKSLTGNVEKTSPVDVITEMAAFVRNQILTQSTVVTLGRSSAMPRMALHLMAS